MHEHIPAVEIYSRCLCVCVCDVSVWCCGFGDCNSDGGREDVDHLLMKARRQKGNRGGYLEGLHPNIATDCVHEHAVCGCCSWCEASVCCCGFLSKIAIVMAANMSQIAWGGDVEAVAQRGRGAEEGEEEGGGEEGVRPIKSFARAPLGKLHACSGPQAPPSPQP